jgi:phage tail sheath protein FI
MPFQLSPGVAVVEKDFTSIVPAVATSIGATAGAFSWGPVMEPTTVSSENELVRRFGKPNDSNAQSFFAAANFLSYTNNLLLVRADAGHTNAVASGSAIKITNTSQYLTSYSAGEAAVGEFAARYPGTAGNSILVSMADSQTYDGWEVTLANGITLDLAAQFDYAPGTSAYCSNVGGSNDELHIIVIDEDGVFTGIPGTVLEKFAYVSKASDAKKSDGTNNYYKDAINARSQYIYWMDHTTSVTTSVGGSGTSGAAWGSAATADFKDLDGSVDASLTGGTDDFALTDAEKIAAFQLFDNSEQFDVSLIIAGKASTTVATSLINNIAEVRLDCVVFVSPEDDGDIIIGSTSTEVTAINAYRDALPSSSYAVMDSGYKYQYDRYNDKYRWIPLNADVAGLCARTDYTNDPWFSPGGLNRGQIKNVVKLAVNPNKTQRDALYKNGVNPVVTFPGEGTVLFGDKTLLAAPSAFDRINVRRLFIVMEKAIATAAKFQLFEFNDGFTRAQFKNLVEPFLRDVQGRRGITDFVVKCDESNNTGEVIDRNEFVADIFVKPNRSINFITLTFVAARSAINFSEIGA